MKGHQTLRPTEAAGLIAIVVAGFMLIVAFVVVVNLIGFWGALITLPTLVGLFMAVVLKQAQPWE